MKTQEQIIEDVIVNVLWQEESGMSKEDAQEDIDQYANYEETKSITDQARNIVVELRQAGFEILPDVPLKGSQDG